MKFNILEMIKNKGIETTVAELELQVAKDDKYINLNYHQFLTPRDSQAACECRGLLLDKTTMEVVAYPFYRFFNKDEGFAAKVEFTSQTVIWEKVDGSLVYVWFDKYQNKWIASTRGSIYGQGSVGRDTDYTFNQYFWDTCKKHHDLYNAYMNDTMDHKIQFIFELYGPMNKVVTKYEEADIKLLGGRNTDTWDEMPIELLEMTSKFFGVDMPKKFNINDLEGIFNNLRPDEEGYVFTDYGQMVNGSYARVKCKNPTYVVVHNLLGNNVCEKKFFELMRLGEADEVTAVLPEYKEDIAKINVKIDVLVKKIETVWEANKNLETQKDFALAVKDCPFSGVLFAMRKGLVTDIRKNLYDISLDKAWELIENDN